MNMMPNYLHRTFVAGQQGHGSFMQGNYPPGPGQSGFQGIPVQSNYPHPPGQGNFSDYMQGGHSAFFSGQMQGNFVIGPVDQSSFVDGIISDLKSKGLYDKFRKECTSDADMKPAYRNLNLRVESNVLSFLDKIKFTDELNKSLIREQLRKHLTDCKIMDSGVERIVEQLVLSKVDAVFHNKVQEVVLGHLGVENPASASHTQEEQDKQKDLEAISSDSSNGDQSRNKSDQVTKKPRERKGKPELAASRTLDPPSPDLYGFMEVDRTDDTNIGTKRPLVPQVPKVSGTDDPKKTGNKTSTNKQADKHKTPKERKDDKDKTKDHRQFNSGKSDNKNSSSIKKTDGKDKKLPVQEKQEKKDKTQISKWKINLKDPEKNQGKERQNTSKQMEDKSERHKEKSTKDNTKSDKEKFEKHGEKLTKDNKKLDKGKFVREKTDIEKLPEKITNHKSKSVDKAKQEVRSSFTKHRSTSTSSSRKDTSEDKTHAKEKRSSSRSTESSHKDKHLSTPHHKQSSSEKSKVRSELSFSSKNKDKKSGGDSKSSGRVKKTEESKSDKKEGKKVTDDHYSFKDKKHDRRSPDRDSNDESSKKNTHREDFLKSHKHGKGTDVSSRGSAESTDNPDKVKQAKTNGKEVSNAVSDNSDKVKQAKTNKKEVSNAGSDNSDKVKQAKTNKKEVSNAGFDNSDKVKQAKTNEKEVSKADSDNSDKGKQAETNEKEVSNADSDKVEQAETDEKEVSKADSHNSDKVKQAKTNGKEVSQADSNNSDKVKQAETNEKEVSKADSNNSDKVKQAITNEKEVSNADSDKVEQAETNEKEVSNADSDKVEQAETNEKEVSNADSDKVEQAETDEKEVSKADSEAKQETTNKQVESGNLNTTDTENITITDDRMDVDSFPGQETEYRLVRQETTSTQKDSSTHSTHSDEEGQKTTNEKEDLCLDVCPDSANNLDVVEQNITATQEGSTTNYNTDNITAAQEVLTTKYNTDPESSYEEELGNLNITEEQIKAIIGTDLSSLIIPEPEPETSHFEAPAEIEDGEIGSAKSNEEFVEGNVDNLIGYILNEGDIDRSEQMSDVQAGDEDLVYFFEKPLDSEAKLRKYDENIERLEKDYEQCQAGIEPQSEPTTEIGKKRKRSPIHNNNDDELECKRLRSEEGQKQDECDVEPCNGSMEVVADENEDSADLQKSFDGASIDHRRQLVVNVAREVLVPPRAPPSKKSSTLGRDKKKARSNEFEKPKHSSMKRRKANKGAGNQRYNTEDLFKPRKVLSATSRRRQGTS